jgi:hypothetical protein
MQVDNSARDAGGPVFQIMTFWGARYIKKIVPSINWRKRENN